MAHGQWTEVEARAALKEWRKSGLSVEKFAKQRGLVPQRLYFWRKKLEAPAEPITLVPVKVAEPKRGEPVLVMLRSGHMVKVARGFDEEALARVIAVLEGA